MPNKKGKNNCAGAVFTRYEKQEASRHWGTQRVRVGTEAQRRIDSCHICLYTARDAVCCPEGHIFCRECIMQALLDQRLTNDRLMKEWEAEQVRKREEKLDSAAEEEQKRLEAFAAREQGIRAPSGTSTSTSTAAAAAAAEKRSGVADNISDATAALPSFWIPELAPEAKADAQKPDGITRCPQDNAELKLKKLIDVKMTPIASGDANGASKADDEAGDDKHQCPMCVRPLRNGMKLTLLRKCGHVMCESCVARIAEKQCVVCQEPFKEKHLVKLSTGGTSFAGSGEKVEAEAYRPAFYQ